MGFFRKTRGPRLPDDPAPEAVAGETTIRRGPPLVERLSAIADAGGRPEEAFEPAMEAVLESTGATGGAICLYDVRHGVLRLTAERGLSDEGCRRLRSVRRGDPACWDMPLHGLLNRRAYLIESAARNRYVPPLIEAVTLTRTVACVPIIADGAPLGSLVLVAAGSRSFSERDVKQLWKPLRELARLIEAVRRQAGLSGPVSLDGPVPRRTVAVVDVVALSAERDQLREERDALAAELAQIRGSMAEALEAAAAAQRAQVEREAALAQARADAERSAELGIAELERLQREGAERAEAAERRAREQAVLIERLERRLAEAEAALAAEREHETALATRVEELARAQEAAAAREASLRGDLEAARLEHLAVGEAGLAEAEAALRHCEASRVAAESQLGAAREDLTATHARVESLEAEVARALAERGEAEARLAEVVAERDRLLARIAGLEAAMAAAQSELAGLRAELTTVRLERDALRAEASAATAERESLRAQLAAATPPEPLTLGNGEVADDSVTVIAVDSGSDEEPPAPVGDPGAPVLVVLDAPGARAVEPLPGHRVVVLPADATAAERIRQLAPERVIVNLAAPNVLPTLLALRAAGCTARFWGCIADAAGVRALAIGQIEPTVAPLDPDAVIEALGPYAARDARIVTTGSDVDALMSLRQALSRRRASVSMAWDGKQAAEVLAVVKPVAVVVDLDLPRRDGYGVIAQLASADPVPFAVLLGGTEDAPAALAAQLSDARHAARVTDFAAVLADLAARAEPVAVVERQQPKVRFLHGTGR